jgi:hypothetical protein
MTDSNQSNNPPQGPIGDPVFNIVTDTVTGPNLRWKDNVYQAIVIVVCLILGALTGFLVIPGSRGLGAVTGGFAGLLVGLFGSGIFLMVFRGVKHLRGKHD